MPATTPPRTAGIGPWTVHLCVTAACTGCGGVPADEDTGLAPHFASPDQAIEELTQEWGWYFAAFPVRLGMAEELLCPGCTAAAGYAVTPWPPAHAAGPDDVQEPEAAQEYVVPIISTADELVAWLCRSCDTKLDADPAVREEDL